MNGVHAALFKKDFPARATVRADLAGEDFLLFAAGMIRPPIWARLPLAEAGKAQALIEGGRVLGKVILKP